jgi:heat shock protein HtpX
MDNLFSTHPSTENRIAALSQLAHEMGRGGYADFQPQPERTGPWSRRPASGPWGRLRG